MPTHTLHWRIFVGRHRGETLDVPSHSTHAGGDVAADDSLIARARVLEPILRHHAETTERERRLAGPVLEAMREAGLFRMFTPRALGGLEADPVTVARVAEEVTRADSAAAWALQAGNTGSCPPAGEAIAAGDRLGAMRWGERGGHDEVRSVGVQLGDAVFREVPRPPAGRHGSCFMTRST